MAPNSAAVRECRTRRRLARSVAVAATSLALGGGIATNLTVPAHAETTYKVVTSADWKRLHVRSGPGTSYEIVDKLRRGTPVSIECTDPNGPRVKGPLGSSTVWDKIGTNPDGTERWVSDQYLNTGSDDPVAPTCEELLPQTPQTPPAPEPPAQQIDYEFDGGLLSEIRFNMAATQLAATSEGEWCKVLKAVPKKALPLKLIAKGEENFCKIGYAMFRDDAKRYLANNQCLKWQFAVILPRTTGYDSEFCYRR